MPATVAVGGTPARVFDIFDGYRVKTPARHRATRSGSRSCAVRRCSTPRQFTISSVAGHNNAPAGIDNPVTGTCASCHNQLNAGSSRMPHSQRDIGVGGTAGGHQTWCATDRRPPVDLPIFEVTCKPGYTTAFNGTKVQTNDIGLAMISGHCADVGRFTVPTLRALASRAPYFHDGSAQTLRDVADFYKGRFNMDLGGNDRDDLAAFLAAL